MEIKFSRHAKNKLRLYRLVPADVEEAIHAGVMLSLGDKRESRYGKLRVIWIMVGSYALVVTIIKSR